MSGYDFVLVCEGTELGAFDLVLSNFYEYRHHHFFC